MSGDRNRKRKKPQLGGSPEEPLPSFPAMATLADAQIALGNEK